MKALSAKASFSDKAKQLFASKDASAVHSGVIKVRTGSESQGSFKVGGFTVRTERTAASGKFTVKKR